MSTKVASARTEAGSHCSSNTSLVARHIVVSRLTVVALIPRFAPCEIKEMQLKHISWQNRRLSGRRPTSPAGWRAPWLTRHVTTTDAFLSGERRPSLASPESARKAVDSEFATPTCGVAAEPSFNRCFVRLGQSRGRAKEVYSR